MSDIKIPELTPELERGPQWLKDLRQSERSEYNKSDLPPRGLHLWRYTDPNRFVVDKEKTVDAKYSDSFEANKKAELENLKQGKIETLVIDKGGCEIEFFGVEKLEAEGIIVSTLSEAVKNHEQLVNEYLYKLVNSKTGKFEALNGALWNDGIFIYVPKNKQVKAPIHLLRESALEGSNQFPRLLVVVGENAELTLVDEYSGGAENLDNGFSYSNSSIELFGHQNSHTRYVMLQRQSAGHVGYLCHRASLENSASMITIPLSFGGAVSKQNFGVMLNGKGADSNMYGLLFGSQKQHFDNHTLHHHTVGNTTSNIDFKVVLKDKANSAYTGLIRIDNSAKTCEAYQENRNLLLNKGTKAETIPELEILNEDVMCSHGATIGPLDEEMVFFSMGRGINRAEAIRMIVGGFVQKSLKMVPEDLRERINDSVIKRLENI